MVLQRCERCKKDLWCWVEGYNVHLSKPLESKKSCGRISPYLAWGNVSVRQAFQFVKSHPRYPLHKRGFYGLLTRLKWRCHFVQKFEGECDYAIRCVNLGYESMSYTNDERLLKAWEKGRTGFPLVDACIRCLKATGWINCRIRAMLVSTLVKGYFSLSSFISHGNWLTWTKQPTQQENSIYILSLTLLLQQKG